MNPYKFNVLTVMHTGTRFLNIYLKRCGMIFPINYPLETRPQYRDVATYEMNHFSSHWNPTTAKIMTGTKAGYPTLSILRDPLLNALSWLERNKSITECVESWNQFINYASYTNTIFFDIDCPEEYRESHLLNITKQLGFYDESLIELTHHYAKEWKPIGATDSPHKTAYLRDGTLPELYTWGRFERATKWYNMKLKECVY